MGLQTKTSSSVIPTPTTPAVADVPCPRCGKPLTDPGGLGWCQECGYCHSLEDPTTKKLVPVEAARPAAAAVAIKQAGQAVSKIPIWFYVLVTGLFLIVLLTHLQNQRLPAMQQNAVTPTQTAHALKRAVWTTVQMGAGIVLVFIAQIIALVRIAPEDPTLSIKDMFLPFRLWSQVFRRANRVFIPILMASWGLAITLSACIFIGGLGHWMTYLPKSKDAARNANVHTR